MSEKKILKKGFHRNSHKKIENTSYGNNSWITGIVVA